MTLKVQLLLIISIVNQLSNITVSAAQELGTFVDCTSNQAEYYTELGKPSRKQMLQESIELAAGIHSQFPEVTFEELAVEIAVSFPSVKQKL